MKRFALLAGLLPLGWLATGFYVVGGNEKAVVRRCGEVQRTAGGAPALRSSGLHYDLPWPFANIDRVNLSEVRTLVVGRSELEDFSDGTFAQSVDPAAQSRFLTGDKNVLNLKFGVQYRVAEEQVDAYLFGTNAAGRGPQAVQAAVERRLGALAEGVLCDLVARSGVDFVHTHGRAVIQERLTDRLRETALQQRLGVRVDTVTLDVVEPPLRVRAAFLEVNNARADKEKYVHAANAYAAERLQASRADAAQVVDEAESERRQAVEQARAQAESFEKLVAQFHPADSAATPLQETARRIALQRMYLETMEDILRRSKLKVILESGKPVDLTIVRDPQR